MANMHMRIKVLRESRQLKQHEVANYLGISQQAYSYYELDKRELPSRHVVNLARLYQETSDYILGIEEDQMPPYNLNVKFTSDTSFKDVVVTLGKLNKNNRREIVKYLSYLSSSQEEE